MKKCIIALLLVFFGFETSSTKRDIVIWLEEIIVLSPIKRVNRDNVYEFVYNRTKDKMLTIRVLSIVQTETGFNSNVLKTKKNVCGFTNSKGYKSYSSYEDSLDELIDYEKRKGKKSWYWYTHPQYTNEHRKIYYNIYNQNLTRYGR
jgi:hypothetical protein